jgi:glycerophosphoryl diester phosphodiesterase
MATASIKRFLGGVLVMGLVVGNVVPIKPAYAQREAADKIVVAHRGASGYLPEHTLPAVAMAYAMGADFMEQDVVMTRDDQLIVWHDLTLDRNTDVRNQFPGRARDDGRHYVVDFDLAELRQLKVTEGYRLNDSGVEEQIYPQRFPLWQGSFQIHTFAEQLQMVQGLNRASGQDIGIYTEIKSPAFYHDNGKDVSTAIISELKRFGYTSKDSNVFLQTFEYDELKRVHDEVFPALGVELKLVQLMGDDEEYQWMLSASGMRDLARYADGVGPEKGMIISPDSTRNGLIISSLVSDAHQAGMQVHPYTFRQDEGQIVAYADNFEHMLELFFFEANVDGLFTDFPDRAVDFLREHD